MAIALICFEFCTGSHPIKRRGSEWSSVTAQTPTQDTEKVLRFLALPTSYTGQ